MSEPPTYASLPPEYADFWSGDGATRDMEKLSPEDAAHFEAIVGEISREMSEHLFRESLRQAMEAARELRRAETAAGINPFTNGPVYREWKSGDKP